MLFQHRLVAEPQYQAVLSLVEKYLPKFDVVNMVCALHMCAVTARDHEHLKRQMQVDPNFITLFHTAKQHVLADVSACSPRTSSDFLWCCAHLSIFDSDLFNEIIGDATRRLEAYSAHGIALLVFALGYVGQRPRAAFMQALVRELRARIGNEFSPQNVSMIVYGMMRLEIRDERLMKIVSEHLLETMLEGFEDLSTVCLAYAYTKLEYWDEKVFSLLGRRVITNLNVLDMQMATMVSLCFAKSTEFVRESSYIMETIMRAVEASDGKLDQFSNRQLATFCFAAGKFRYLQEALDESPQKPKSIFSRESEPLATEFVNQVANRSMASFTMSELNLINYSLMRMKHRDPKFLDKAAEQFVRGAPELQSIEICNAMYAFCRVEYVNIKFVNAMLEEVRRRGLVQVMQPLEIATLAYSMAMCRIRDDEILEEITVLVCERVREFAGQQMSMVLYALAVLHPRKHGEALVSVCMEDITTRFSQFEPLSMCVAIWASAIISGTSSALWVLKLFFHPSFWKLPWSSTSYSMIYTMMASLRAEEGIQVEELTGWNMCDSVYQEFTAQTIGMQNQRLSDRLRMQNIPHMANALPPKLEGFNEVGIRSDIVIEKLKLIIEVEGPQRMTIPLDSILAELGDDGDLAGSPDDVIGEARAMTECGLTGSANFKRRLLRKCGWRVVTVSFDENEEYIADALTKMTEKGGLASTPSQPDPEKIDRADGESGEIGTAAASEMAQALEDGPGAALGSSYEAVQEEQELSEYEANLRVRHAEALEELQQRVAAQRGDAAASASFSSHLEYRQWQVGVEKEVFQEMLALL